MAAIQITASNVPTQPQPQRLSPGFLLSIYAVVPLCLLFILADYLLFDLHASRSLPSDPESMGWLNIIFMLPHVIASIFTFADREYISTYSTRLAVSSLGLGAGVLIVPVALGVNALILVLALYTAYHQIAQQAGIASIITRNRSRTHAAWKWYSLFILIAVFTASLADPDVLRHVLTTQGDFFYPLFAIVGLGYLVISILVARQSRTRIGVAFIAANGAMLITHCFLFSLRLGFFMILIPRIIHDVTAFAFYVSHNINRNREQSKNLITKLTKPLAVPEYLATPALAILCSVMLTSFMPKPGLVFCLPFLALFHYYWEGVMWKNGAPHRNYLYV